MDDELRKTLHQILDRLEAIEGEQRAMSGRLETIETELIEVRDDLRLIKHAVVEQLKDVQQIQLELKTHTAKPHPA